MCIYHGLKTFCFLTTHHNIDLSNEDCEEDTVSNIEYKKYNFTATPEFICDYNKNMNCVERFDQYCHNYDFDVKSTRWTFKITLFLLHNSFVLFKQRFCLDIKDNNIHQKYVMAAIKWLGYDIDENITFVKSKTKTDDDLNSSDDFIDENENQGNTVEYETKRGIQNVQYNENYKASVESKCHLKITCLKRLRCSVCSLKKDGDVKIKDKKHGIYAPFVRISFATLVLISIIKKNK